VNYKNAHQKDEYCGVFIQWNTINIRKELNSIRYLTDMMLSNGRQETTHLMTPLKRNFRDKNNLKEKIIKTEVAP
jgi:hypothetical protein